VNENEIKEEESKEAYIPDLMEKSLKVNENEIKEEESKEAYIPDPM
jgi:hypothetical protein